MFDWALLLFLLLTTWAQDAGYPPGYDGNCSLVGNSLYPWVVRIWDTAEMVTMAHGSIIAYMAVLSTCYEFGDVYKKEPKNLLAIAPRVKKSLSDTCSQAQSVREIIEHEKCSKPATRRRFDFAVLFLEKPFFVDKISLAYPAMNMAQSAEGILMDIIYVNEHEEYSQGCEVVYYADRKSKAAKFTDYPNFVTIPYIRRCVKLFCEENPPDNAKTSECTANFLVPNSTIKPIGQALCVKSSIEGSHIPPLTPPLVNWYAGAPLVCNATGIGHVSGFKDRSKFSSDQIEFFFCPTYLRVWPWLRAAREIFGASWIKPIFVNDLDLKTEYFPPPSRAPITDQLLPFREPVRPKSNFHPEIRGGIASLHQISCQIIFNSVLVSLLI